jgi:hypothetical protein
MNIFKAYIYGLKESVKIPKPVFLIYLINVILGVFIALPLYGLLKRELGYSESVDVLLQKFDTSLFSDFIYQNKDGIRVLLSQIVWVALVYWIISIFLAGGIIRTLNQDKFTMTSFFSGAGYNFFRFLKISLVMALTQIILVILILIPVYFIISDNTTESELFLIFSVVATIWAILFLAVLLITDYSKFYSVLYDKGSVFQSIKGGLVYVINNFFKTYILYLMLIILPALVVIGYFWADANIGTHTAIGVFVVFLIQQIFIILRIWFRVWTYASPLQMYTADFLKTEDVQMRIALMNEWNEKAKEQQLGLTEISKVTEAEISNEDLRAENVEEKVITEEEMLRQMREEEERQKELEKAEKLKAEEEEKQQKELEKAEKQKAADEEKQKQELEKTEKQKADDTLKHQQELDKTEKQKNETAQNAQQTDTIKTGDNKKNQSVISDLKIDEIPVINETNQDIKARTKDNKAKALTEVKNELKNAKSKETENTQIENRIDDSTKG